jgi:hypothetical protein
MLLMIVYGIFVLILAALPGKFLIDTGLIDNNFFFFTDLFSSFSMGLALISGGYMTRKSSIYLFITLGAVIIMIATSNEIKMFLK